MKLQLSSGFAAQTKFVRAINIIIYVYTGFFFLIVKLHLVGFSFIDL